MDPRPLDALDLKLLQALQLDGRAPFSRIGEVLGVADSTVARRFRRLRTTAGVRVIGMTNAARLGRTTWIVRLRCNPNVAERLAEALARRPDTGYIDLISGGTEVLCSMRPRSVEERDELLLDRLQRTPRVTSVSAHCLLNIFYGVPYTWLDKIQALDPNEEEALRPPPIKSDDTLVTLDATDEAMLAILARDGRTTSQELQAGTGESESAVKRRMDRLRSSGALYFDVQHDAKPLGQGVRATLWLTVAPASLSNVGRALADHHEVRFAAATTGQANVMATVVTPGTPELYTYISERIGALPGIHTVETALTLRQVKQLTYEPIRRASENGVFRFGNKT